MKPQTLPTKRRPISKGIFKRLSAVTGNRKQRVAATANPADMDMEDGSSKISRALTIIFLIHIVAIGLIFIHQKFLDGRSPTEPKTAAKKQNVAPLIMANSNQRLNLPILSSGEQGYFVKQGDNYARIATTLGVDEGDLRLINGHADIKSGNLLKVPQKRVTAIEPVATPLQEQALSTATDDLVEAVPLAVVNAPRAKEVDEPMTEEQPAVATRAKATPVRATETSTRTKPKTAPKVTPVATSGKSYVVKSGDNIWRIANKLKVNQAALMKANGITDPKKMKTGMNLVIPH
jgi:LysM repeat protein